MVSAVPKRYLLLLMQLVACISRRPDLVQDEVGKVPSLVRHKSNK
jgi:hypothetical protein